MDDTNTLGEEADPGEPAHEEPMAQEPVSQEPTAVMPPVEEPPAEEAPPGAATPAEAAATEATEAEEPPRRAGRRILIALIAIAIAGAAGYFGYTTLSGRLAARADLERALDLVKEADAVVLAVDDVVRAEITRTLASQAEETSAQVPAALASIDEALSLLDGAYEDLDTEDREVADVLREAADARIAMLDEAPTILGANIAASRALGPAGDGIDAMLEAEELSSQAAEKFNLQTKEGVTASTELSNRAIRKLNEARQEFREAMRAFPEADMSAFLEYIRAKKALVEKSREIDELWLANKIADANELVDEYNDQDAEVAELGDELPDSETKPIARAYEKLTAEATERYFAARDEAARADTRLRQLLGTEEDVGSGETTGTASEDATSAPSKESTAADE